MAVRPKVGGYLVAAWLAGIIGNLLLLGSPQLQVVDRSPAVDLARAEQAVASLLAALGQDPSSERLHDTPRRVAAGYAELLTAAPFTPHHLPQRRGL